MPAVQGHAPGSPCWIDLSTRDMAKAEIFYSGVFGWTFEEPSADSADGFGGYRMIYLNGRAVAGAMPRHSPSMPEVWSVYLMVEDAEASAAAVTAAGGQVIVPPMVVGPRGTMMFALDPAGAAIGGWQPGDFAGFEVVGEHGAPMWFETLSKDYPASVAFYQEAFGWQTATMSDTEEFRYTTLGAGEEATAGIMDAAGLLPEQVPSMWQAYLGVVDADAALVTAVELGGSVISPAQDTPYGRMAQVADPTGAMVSVMQHSSLTR